MIRTLTRDDAVSYRELRLKALRTDPTAFLSTFEHELLRSLPEFEYELSSSRAAPCFGYYGLFDEMNEKKLIGFCQCTTAYFPKQEHVAYMYNLYVDPEFRNQGHAKKLLTHILEILKENQIEIVAISHVANNVAAHQLYANLGFRETGRKNKTVKWNDKYDDEVDMMLELTG